MFDEYVKTNVLNKLIAKGKWTFAIILSLVNKHVFIYERKISKKSKSEELDALQSVSSMNSMGTGIFGGL
jgi:hypothetical protein